MSRSICRIDGSTARPMMALSKPCNVTACAFSSPRSGSTVEMYSLNALPGDRTAMWLASNWSRWWYMRYAARCMATLVLPEPAPPTTDKTRALSCRIAMFCSC